MTDITKNSAGQFNQPAMRGHKYLYSGIAALGVAGAYFLSALAGLQLAVVHNNVTAIWPPSGIALAALLLLGIRLWPAITIAAILVNLYSGLPLATAVGIASGNTLAAVTGVLLVQRLIGARINPLNSMTGLLALAGGGALLASVVSATVGTSSLVITGAAAMSGFGSIWLTWWLGDSAGVLVFTPLLLTWCRHCPVRWHPARLAEGLLLLVTLVVTVQLVFGGWFSFASKHYPLSFIPISVLLWSALRFGRHGATAGTALTAVFAIWGTVLGYGPFITGDLNTSLLLLQFYIGVTGLSSLALAVSVHERLVSQRRLQLVQEQMEQRIQARTRELADTNMRLQIEMDERKETQDMAAGLGQILEESVNEIYIFDADSLRFVNVNQGARDNLGYTMEELSRMTPVDIKPEVSQEVFVGLIAPLKNGKRKRLRFETVHSRKDGSRYPVEAHLQHTRLGARQVFVAIILDITERQESQARLKQAATVFDHSTECIMITDAASNIIGVNKAFTTVTGYTEAEVLGEHPGILKSRRHFHDSFEAVKKSIPHTGPWQGEIWNRKKNGTEFPSWMSISEVRDQAEVVTNYVCVFSDISMVKKAQEQVNHLAYHDPLTNLPNRILFNDRLEHSIQFSRRTNKQMALLFIDLDGFKNINDTYGHAAGDCVLQEVARRLINSVREVDTVARLSGDEFTIILEGINEQQNVVNIVERILADISSPFVFGQHKGLISASIGISMFPDDGMDAATLLNQADNAMYQSKKSGGRRYSFYLEGMMSGHNTHFTQEDIRKKAN